ncbi:TPA: hypothetical protein DCS34_01525 [Candidatus Peribacteria bacterium]|nr:MAG: hypothetical protein A2529_05195 [Candidatus Peribacteria bacterium RIFOXYD2_FULL_58_15]HAS33973.1 hypothetical protein [Candidatus Peribacteria bacterium]
MFLQFDMPNRLLSIFFGTLMGLCVPFFIWVLFVEHLTFFVIFPIFPIAGVTIGLVFGWMGRIPPLKVWVSLLVFTIFIVVSIGYAELRGFLMRLQREHAASVLSMQYPGSTIIEQKYSGGNGMEIPPNVSMFITATGSFVGVAKYYDGQFGKNGWQPRARDWSVWLSWRKGNYEVFLHNENSNSEKVTYRLDIDFLGYWMTHISKDISEI